MRLHPTIGAALAAVVTTVASGCSNSSTAVDAGASADSGSTVDAGTSGGVTTDLGTFSLTCGTATKDFPFAAAKTEVIRFDATWKTANGDAVPDAVVLDAAGQTIDKNGNPLGLGPGLLSTTEKTTTLVHEFFTVGNHTLRFSNSPPGCNTITVSTKYTRLATAVTNTAQAGAIALTKNAPSASHLGCSTERWYKLTATSGEALSVVVTGERFAGVPSDVVATVTLDLLDGAGAPVVASGNPVSASGELGNAGSQFKLEHTTTAAGTFHLKMTQSGCAGPLNYTIKY